MPSYVVITNSAGVAYGEGPIYRATRWRATERLDKAGECSFEVPAADPRALALLENKREAHYWTQVNGVPTEVGALIIDKIETILQGRAEPMLRVSGGNLLHELAYRTVGGLELYDVETKTATAVSHVWRYGDGTIYSSDLMAEAYDNNHGTVYQIDIGIKAYNYLYVGAATPISACTIDFTNMNTGDASTLAAQYFDGTDWQTLTISSDGTHDGTRTLAQDGKIVFTRPTNQDKTTHDGVLAYWARLYPSAETSDAIYIAEVDVDQDCETLAGLADIMAYAPPGWTVDDSGDGYAGTQNGAYMQFAGETVLEALTMLAEHTGEHWRLGAGKTIEWLQDDPAVAPVDSGVYAVQHPTTAGCAILELAETRESTQQYSRVYPYGAGAGAGRVTLAYCTETPPGGYTLSTSGNYIVHDATEAAIGQIEAVRTWAEAGQMEDNAAHSVLAANELYQVALEYLKRQIAVQYAYSVRVADLKATVRPGETVRVTYQRHRDGTRYVDIDGALVVLGVDLIEDGAGVQTAAFEVATTDSWPMTGAEFLVREIRNARRRSAGNGASGGPGGVVVNDVGLGDLALNSVILLKQGSEYPVVYSLDSVGFAAAIAAAGSRDAIWTGAGTILGDHTIPAEVTVASMPFSRTAFTGQLTQGNGSVLNGMELYRRADQAGDLICIVPPSGAGEMAYCGYCWIVANNATGAGYAVKGACDHLTLRDCFVSAQSAGVDSNPFAGVGGGWPERTWAATKTLGVYYTADSLNPAAAQPTWAAVNTGLSNTDIISFCLDRHEAVADSRMFCIDGTTKTVWRRTGGNWAAVLTSAAARATAGFSDNEVLYSVIVDPVTGYVYALLALYPATANKGVVRSVDNGDTWTAVTMGARGYSNAWGNIDAYGGVVVAGRIPSPAVAMFHYFSTNDGASFGSIWVEEAYAVFEPVVRIHPAAGDTWYGTIRQSGGGLYDLLRLKTAATYAVLMDGQLHGPYASSGGVWPDPADANHLLIAVQGINTAIVESTDAGATADSDVATSVTYMHEIADGCEYGYWVQGCSIPHALNNRAPVYVSTDGVTLGQKSGTNWATPPYTNALPVTCGGISGRGLWVVSVSTSATPYVEGCIIPNAAGRAAAIPEYGDRASWHVYHDNGATHAEDWAAGDSHHKRLTLAVDADAMLGLSGQQLTMDSQDANTVLAGPASGAAADPTFRALVAADVGTGVPTGALFLRDDMSWQTPAGGSEWSVLTNGDPVAPELVYADGDCIMVEW